MAEPSPPSLTYESDIQCPVCQRGFRATKIRKTALRTDGRDADFNIRYTDVDANLYSVWVCPHCGYAATDQVFDQVNPAERKLLTDALAGRPIPNCQGERDDAAGIAAIEQAMFCAGARGGKASALAGLHLRLAWIYRRTGDPREREQLEIALDHYTKAYSSEPLPIGKMSGATLAYLIGELSRRLGRYHEAVQYFQIAVKDAGATEPQTAAMARQQWELAREEAAASTSAGGPAAPAETAPAPEPAAVDSPGAGPAETRGAAPDIGAPEGGGGAPIPQAPPAKASAGAPARRTITATLPLYPEHLAWLKKVATRNGFPLDPGIALRAVLEVAAGVDPGALRGGGEEEIAAALREALRRG